MLSELSLSLLPQAALVEVVTSGFLGAMLGPPPSLSLPISQSSFLRAGVLR